MSEVTEQQHGQECNLMTQIELSINKITLALAPNSAIPNQPHPPPLISLLPVDVLTTTAAIYAAPVR
jgi:hypothetical protein